MDWLGRFVDILYGCILSVLLVGTGLYFTFRTGMIQFRGLRGGISALREGGNLRGMLISTGARVGTGNIAGVAAAIAIGGPGAMFWMWLTALLGAASAFAESVLAQKYHRRQLNGWVGGAAFYMRDGLGRPRMGAAFTVALIACFGGAMNALQAYQTQSTLSAYGLPPIAVAVGLTLLTALCIRGDEVGRWSEILVPLMTVGFLLLTTVVMVLHWRELPQMLFGIIRDAFSVNSFAGGLASSALGIGLRRGLFTNEAGMGSAPQAAAAAEARHPADQGMAQVLSVYIDTILLCSATAFLLLLSGADAGNRGEIGWVQAAVSTTLGDWAIHVVTLSVLCFAFTSILSGYFYAASASSYLSRRPWMQRLVRVVCLLTVFFGSLSGAELVWQLTDLCMAFMAVLNLIALWKLRHEVIECVKTWVPLKAKRSDCLEDRGSLPRS